MVMKLTISNRAAYTILAVFLILGISGIAYASLQTPPNPGHAVSEIQTCSNGESLVMSGGSWTCTSASDPCVYATTPLTPDNYFTAIDLIHNGKNICADNNGCLLRLLVYNAANPQGHDLYGAYTSSIFYTQDSAGKFYESYDNRRGTNGDATDSLVLSSGDYNQQIYDDYAGIDSSPDKLVLRDYATAYGMKLTICDY